MKKFNHFTSSDQILSYLQANPSWVSGFVNGEGSFTASFMTDVRALWGIWPQCEFNITQLMDDVLLLEALHAFFDNQGGVYSRKNNVGTVSFRKISVLKNTIVPFFLENPLLGLKSYEFERWVSLVELLNSQKHISYSLSGRDALIDFAIICKELNSKRNNPRKEARSIVIINWLQELSEIPSSEAKLALKIDIQEALINLKNEDLD
jgi:hypothetical protein